MITLGVFKELFFKVMKRSDFYHFCPHEQITYYFSPYHHKQSPSLQTFKIERVAYQMLSTLKVTLHKRAVSAL